MRPQKSNRKVARPCSERLSQDTNEREWSKGKENHGKRRLLRSSRAESMEGANRSGGQAFWNVVVRGGSAGNSAGQEQATLLVGTSHSHTRRDAAVVGAPRTTSSRVGCRLRLESRQIASRHSFAPRGAP